MGQLVAATRWYEMADEAKLLRRRMQKLVKKMMNNQIAGAFEKWLEAWEEAVKTRVILGRCMAGRCKLNAHLTQRLKATGFKPSPLNINPGFKMCRIKFNLRRYSMAKMANRTLAGAYSRLGCTG
jgi:dienelactone hydrolase